MASPPQSNLSVVPLAPAALVFVGLLGPPVTAGTVTASRMAGDGIVTVVARGVSVAGCSAMLEAAGPAGGRA
jgi:hypothetical protein